MERKDKGTIVTMLAVIAAIVTACGSESESKTTIFVVFSIFLFGLFLIRGIKGE